MVRVSVVLPVYNCEKYIRDAIDSVLSQTLTEIELIVVDDGSDDGTLPVVTSYQDPRVKVLTNSMNCGLAYSRNRGMAEAKGEWIAWIDADDWFHPERLQHMVEVGERCGADIVSDALALVRENEQEPYATVLALRQTIEEPTIISAEQYVGWGILYQPLIRRAFLERTGLQLPAKPFGEDYWFAVECLLRGARWMCIPEAYYFYRQRQGSMSRSGYSAVKQGIAVRQALMDNELTADHPQLRSLLHQDIIREKGEFALWLLKDLLSSNRRKEAVGELVREPLLVGYLLIRLVKALRRRISGVGSSLARRRSLR